MRVFIPRVCCWRGPRREDPSPSFQGRGSPGEDCDVQVGSGRLQQALGPAMSSLFVFPWTWDPWGTCGPERAGRCLTVPAVSAPLVRVRHRVGCLNTSPSWLSAPESRPGEGGRGPAVGTARRHLGLKPPLASSRRRPQPERVCTRGTHGGLVPLTAVLWVGKPVLLLGICLWGS